MANSDVLIRRIIFDLEIPSQDNFQEYSDAVSKIVKERFTIILQDLAMKFKLDSIIFIDNLTVDLGDIDLDNIEDIASAYTPVPGGVGPMTINTLILQTLQSAENTD